MSNQGGPPEHDDSMWRDLARMEAEVVDPEEAQTSHFDYNEVRAQIEAMNPGALAAADAMFGEDDDSDDDEMATSALGQRSPLADGIPGRPEPAGRRPTGPQMHDPGAARRPAPAPRPVPLHQPPPGTDLNSLYDEHDEVPTRMVDGSKMAEMVAKADAERVAAQAGAAAPNLGDLATDDDDDDDDFYDEPTMIAPSAIDALLAQHDVIVNKPKEPKAAPPAIPEPAPSRPEGPPAIPEPAPSRPEAPPAIPEPAPSHPGLAAAAPPAPAPAAAPAPVAAPPAAGPVPSPRASEVDLVHLMNEQKKKDTIMWVIAVVLFAVGVAVLVMKVL